MPSVYENKITERDKAIPRLKNYGPGKRINAWIPERQLAILMQIDNKSKFFQIALDNAAGIMQWAIMKERAPHAYYDTEKIEDVRDKYNAQYPLDALSQKRLKQRNPDERTERTDPSPSPQPDRELW